MNTDFEPIKNGVKFKQDLKNYSNSIEVGGLTLSINSCDFSEGVEVTFDANCTISSSKIHKSCYIGSNITNCIYDSDGTLTINAAQTKRSFKFNKISISGSDGAINGNNIIIRSDDHELNISCSGYGINNSGTLIINNSGSMIIAGGTGIYNSGSMTINNSGLIAINNDATGIYNNSGAMTINNSGSMTINSSTLGIRNNSQTITFNNSSIINLNGQITINGTTTIEITDSLFSIETSNTSTSINFTSTPSTWNGRTFTNSSSFTNFTKASITSYFNSYPSSITLDAKEKNLITISGNTIKNTSDSPLTLCSGPIPLTNPILINNGVVSLGPNSSLYLPQTLKLSENVIVVRGDATLDKSEQNFSIILNETDEPLMEEENATTFGRIILQPHSSFEFPLDFEIPPTVSIIIGNQAKVNNCDIFGNSSVLLGKSIENLIVSCGKVSIG